jgi:flavin-dependent dehydrogenase
VIPKGDFLLIGSALKPTTARKKSTLFLDMVLERYDLSRDIHKKEAWLITRPQNIEAVMLTADNVLLVGESAGLISSSTGEGISFALRSGYYCAQALNENFEDPYKPYDKACKPLIDEVQEKIERANVYKDAYKRTIFFDKVTLEKE